MPVYHRYLKELIDSGIERVSSKELSRITGFSASQIRQDLNNFGGFGQQGYGYNTKALKEQVDKILGIDKSYKSIVIGAGRLGQAIARYKGFRDSGFNVISLFDVKEDMEDISAGVKGIWNFAPYDLKGPEGVVVENIRLNDSLLTLSYFMKEIS